VKKHENKNIRTSSFGYLKKSENLSRTAGLGVVLSLLLLLL
jgi:hypothetical protein